MTEEQEVSGLGAALRRATDALAAPGLAAAALRDARQRRARNRGIAATAVAVAVAAVITLSQLPGRSGTERPVGPSTPSITPSASDRASRAAAAVQPRWDPVTVEDAPLRPSLLPERLEPPDSAAPVADDPMEAAVVAWPEKGQDLRLLGTDRRWRSVPGTADAVRGTSNDVVTPALSPDGRQVAMATHDGILVVDVTTGARRTIPWPSGPLAEPSDTAPALRWLPQDQGFVVLHWERAWLVGLDGSGSEAPYGSASAPAQVAVDPEGTVVERRWDESDLRVWRGGGVVSDVHFPYYGERVVTRYGRLALTGWGTSLPGDNGPMVLDTATGELVAYAPIRDPHSTYGTNGRLSAVGFLDPDTVLLKVGPIRFGETEIGEESWHLVAWRLDTGGFERLTTGDAGMSLIDVAGDVLAAARP